MRVVADASPLIALALLERLDLLDLLFSQIVLPPAVFQEITASGKPYAESLHVFCQNRVLAVQNRIAVSLLANDIDPGEAEAIVLALEQGIVDLLIDDAKGRRVAQLNSLYPIGTLGVLLQAKRLGHIEAVKPLMDMLIANKIRIGHNLYQQALHLADELT